MSITRLHQAQDCHYTNRKPPSCHIVGNLTPGCTLQGNNQGKDKPIKGIVSYLED